MMTILLRTRCGCERRMVVSDHSGPIVRVAMREPPSFEDLFGAVVHPVPMSYREFIYVGRSTEDGLLVFEEVVPNARYCRQSLPQPRSTRPSSRLHPLVQLDEQLREGQ